MPADHADHVRADIRFDRERRTGARSACASPSSCLASTQYPATSVGAVGTRRPGHRTGLVLFWPRISSRVPCCKSRSDGLHGLAPKLSVECLRIRLQASRARAEWLTE